MWKKISYVKNDGSAGYDDAGNLVRMVDPEGHVFEYGYTTDNLLNEIKRTPSGGTPGIIASFSYYPSQRRKDVTLQGGIVHTYHYDAKSRMTSIETTRSDGTVLARFDYEFDSRDRKTKAKLEHLSTEITYGYDCMDRLTSETWTGNGGGAPPPSCSNDIQSLTPGNISLSSVAVCSTPAAPSSVPAFSASWTYDASGNRLTKTVNGQTSNYTYDELNRLTVETPPAPGVQITYGYTQNGNQISRTQGSTVETWGYDYGNRVSTYQKGSAVSYLYRYAPTGERLAKVDLLLGTDNEEWFMYDGQDATADYLRSSGSPTHVLQRTYVNGRAVDSKIARIEAPAPQTMYYYLGDALGTVHEMVDTTGTVVRRVLNTAWGEDLPGFAPTTTVADRHGLTQRERDDESALMHYRARSYDPRLGRFVQKDPLDQVQEHYLYAGDNPVQRTDPSGKSWVPDTRGLLTRIQYFLKWAPTILGLSFMRFGKVTQWDGTAPLKLRSDPSFVGIAVESMLGAGEALYVGVGDFFYVGGANLLDKMLGGETDAFAPARERSDAMGDQMVWMVTHPRQYTDRVIDDASEKLARGDMQGARDFGAGMMGLYTMSRTAGSGAGAAVSGFSRIRAYYWNRLLESELKRGDKRWAAQWEEIPEGTPVGMAGKGPATRQTTWPGKVKVDAALAAGERWVGQGYREMGRPGSGVFRSADGLRQFRMTNTDISGAHGDIGPHVHFQSLDAAGVVTENLHVPIEP